MYHLLFGLKPKAQSSWQGTPGSDFLWIIKDNYEGYVTKCSQTESSVGV